MKEVYIIGAARTPIGKFLGSLSPFSAPELGGISIKTAIERSGVDYREVEDVFMGQVLQAGVGQAPARQAALKAGLPESVSATTINKVCASGLEAVHLGALRIQTGEVNCVVVGGMESMSNAPFTAKLRSHKLGDMIMSDSAVHDGLWCAFENTHMGNLAEFIAKERSVTREEMDQYAWDSHRKAYYGKFSKELIPIKESHAQLLSDENIRGDTTTGKLSKLKSVFSLDGFITAGNSSSLADGAAALVLAEKSWIKKRNLTPLAKVTGYATAANKPRWLFAAPEVAIQKLLNNTKSQLLDYDLLEINEAFAAQILANGKALNWDWDKVNVKGGAIALGHPIGATGARMVVTLVYSLKERELKKGLAALCHGGGGAVAMSFEAL